MKKNHALTALVLGCLGLASCNSSTPTAEQTAAEGQVTVVKSQNDRRDYEYFELENRLRVLVVSDPEAKKAAVSLNVGTGSVDDPGDREGLAHFLEHMLFLGTEKYPVAGEYQKYIAGHGGAHNAYTSFEDTNYFFDINVDYLGQALDRFSQFFISPLFTEKYVEREKHAVESEYRAKYKDEARRGLDVFREVVNPEHPFAQFSVGNLETLADRPDSLVRDDLIKFYQQHYSANRMSLVVLGSESVASLRSMVEQRFATVPDHDVQERAIDVPLFSEGRLPSELLVTPEQDVRSLDMIFPIADPRHYWKAKPIHMIADILGHEGEGSLLQNLKGRGYAESLSAGVGLQYHGGATLNVSLKLTESGFGARDEVVTAVFQAVNRIASTGISRQRFEQQSKVSDIQFRYQDKRENMHYVMGLAASMSRYPAALLLEGPYLFEDYRPDLYQQYLAQLRPDNVLIMVTGPNLSTNRVSHLYQTPYALEPFTPLQQQTWQGAGTNPAIAMPGLNPFIPENFERLVSADPNRRPSLLLTTDKLRIWHGDDAQFTAPRASLRVGFYSPLANDSARHRVLLQLYAATVADRLNPKLYPALLTGFNARLAASRRGLELGIDGFSDKQIGLFEMMLAEIQQRPIDAQRFEDIKQELMRSWQNRKLQPPYQYISQTLRNILYTPSWNEDEQLAVAADLSLADLEQYQRAFLGKLRIDMLAYGNITAKQSAGLKQLVQPLLSTTEETVVLPGVDLVALPDPGRWRYPLSLEHSDAAIAYYVQGASDDNQQRTLMGLTGQIIRTPYYHSLRTEQQFGYVVYAATTVLERMPGLTFIVQSPVADAATLLAASDKMLQDFEQTAQAMTETEFVQHKEALKSLINRPHKNIAHESGFFWEQILQHYLEFDRREQLTQALDQIELEQWRRFYRATFLPLPPRSLVITQDGDHQAGPDAWKGSRLIKDADSFRQAQQQRHYP